MATILVVDDTPISREPIAASLRLAGHKTLCASNGQEALRLLRGACPDLVLLDASMPILDGVATLRRIRANPATVDLPVILLTASTDEHDSARLAALKPAACIAKSRFSMQDLLSTVKRHLPSCAAVA